MDALLIGWKGIGMEVYKERSKLFGMIRDRSIENYDTVNIHKNPYEKLKAFIYLGDELGRNSPNGHTI